MIDVQDANFVAEMERTWVGRIGPLIREVREELHAALARRDYGYSDVPETATVIARTRADLPPVITDTQFKNFMYALEVLDTQLQAIPPATIEPFCVNPLNVS